MLKPLGAICVMLGAVALAVSAIRRLRERWEVLGRLSAALRYMEEELSFHLTPMPALLDHLAKADSGPVGRFFGQCLASLRNDPAAGFRASWRRGLNESLPILRGEARETLDALGETLGQYDGEGQRLALRQAVARLERLREQAAEEKARLGKVYAAVCLAAGLMVVIVLI